MSFQTADMFIGDKLRQARIYNGLTLKELGEMVHATRQYIQQLECGAKSPSEKDPTLELALAEALDVERGFFYDAVTSPIREEHCHFRKRRTTTETIKAQAIEQGNLFDKLVNYIDDKVGLPDMNFPDVEASSTSAASAEEIESLAESMRTRWRLGLKSPISNMTRVLENAGVVATYFGNISDKIDAFSTPRKRHIIVLNNTKGPFHMRFDLAHECGHLIMHTGITTGDPQTEAEAHRFAQAFLLPRGIFMSEFEFLRYGYKIDWKTLLKKKEEWKVSMAAMLRRASDLGMMAPSKYRLACIERNKYYSREDKSEVGDDLITEETPEILNSALHYMKKNGSLGYLLPDMRVRYKFLSKILEGVTDLSEEDFALPSNHNITRLSDL